MRRYAIAVICMGLSMAFSPAARSAGAVSVDALIQQLDDADFARREAAADQLAARGADAIEPLRTAAQGDSPEAVSRSVRLLERLMDSDDPTTVDAADVALMTLASSDHPHAAPLAGAALDRHAIDREERAVAKIRELGGQVQYAPDRDPFGRPLQLFRVEGEPPAEEPPLRPQTILLGKNWKGGLDGLIHLHKLAHRSNLILYVTQGCSVSLAQAQTLAGVLPGLTVHHRGPYLGVGTTTDGLTECVIGDVKSGGPADQAGLQRGDIVLRLNDQRIQRFQDLVDTLKEYAEGNTVTITVQRVDPDLRRARVLSIPVELGLWELAPIVEDVQNRIIFPPAQRAPAPPQKLPPQREAPPARPEPAR